MIPRDLRLEVAERMDASGNVLKALDENALRRQIQSLLDMQCEALVIHFLHAYANPAHELRAAEIASEMWPNAYITMGHSLLSETREFERGVTAAVNASVQPLLERYVARLERMAKRGENGKHKELNKQAMNKIKEAIDGEEEWAEINKGIGDDEEKQSGNTLLIPVLQKVWRQVSGSV